MHNGKVATIRRLNDELRAHHRGGMVFVTNGIQRLDNVAVQQILNAVSAFEGFTDDNDRQARPSPLISPCKADRRHPVSDCNRSQRIV